MKKLLLASTALVLSAGVAAAEVRVGGDARMGIIQPFDNSRTAINENDSIGFTSRIRISFAASGQTDGGLTFGGVIRADNAGGGAGGSDGSVFISGAFGRLSMGDVAGAAEVAVGDVSGVGLTGLGDLNEALYLSNSSRGARTGTNTAGLVTGARPTARYDYSTGPFALSVSASNPRSVEAGAIGADGPLNVYNEGADVYAIGASYTVGAYKLGIGYESLDSRVAGEEGLEHWIAGGSATFGAITGRAFYGAASGLLDVEQYGVSVDYTIDALTLTAFVSGVEVDSVGTDNFGLGAAYSLGGGATVRGGWANTSSGGVSQDAFDFGIALTF